MNSRATRFLVVLIIGVTFIVHCEAQYVTGVGLRAGKFATGLDVKHFFTSKGTTGIEVFGGFTQEANCGYVGKIFLVEQKPIRESRLQVPLKIILGVGGHVGYFRDPLYTIKDGEAVYYPENTVSIGIDGMVGIEYNTRKLPFTIGVDATPYYTFMNPGPEWLDISLNFRYVFREQRR